MAPQKGLATIGPGFGVSRHERERSIQIRDGLVGPVKLYQCRAPVGISRGVAWIQSDRLIIARYCFGKLPRFMQRVAAIIVSVDVLRIYCDRISETCDGIDKMPQRR